MKKLLLLFSAALTMLFTGCTQFDDTRIWDAIDELEDLFDDLDNRVEDLEEACEKMNTNIEALQTLVAALQANDTITSIAPIKQGDKVVGYTISFSKSGPITIYHGNDGKDGANGEDGKDGDNGADGEDGYTPQIGIAKDSDNVYYWTLDGEWLLDENGNKIKAVGTDGKDGEDGEDGANGNDGSNGENGENGADGKDGITPQLEIRDGYWYISYDNGATWKELGKATGEDGKDGADGEDGEDGKDGTDGQDGKDGDSLFQSVTWDEEYAYFTLSDGTVITIPLSTGGGAGDGMIEVTAVDLCGEEDHGMLLIVLSDMEIGDDWDIPNNSRTYGLTFVLSYDDYSVVPQGTFTSEAGNFEMRDGCWYLFLGQDGSEESLNIRDAVVIVSEDKIEATLTLDNGEVHHVVYEGSLVIGEEGGEEGDEEDTTTPPANEIWYTSTDGEIVEPYWQTDWLGNSVFGSFIVSNTYENGKGVIVFDGDVTSIGEYAFSDCSSLASVTIPESVTEIGEGAFAGCESLAEFRGKFASSDGRYLIIDGVLNSFAPAGLTEYTISDSITSIGDYAFSGCSSLASVTIPDSVTGIGRCAFNWCESLASVTIPDSITSIGDYAFYNCSSLASVSIGNGVTSIGEGAFYGCSSLASVTIPDSVTSIGSEAFNYCPNLASVSIGNGVTSIGEGAFYSCSSLVSVTIPDSVTSIGNSAFRCCSSLASVTIPDSVTSIGREAFEYCSSLASVYCKATTPPSLGVDAFYSKASERKIYVPTESVDAYKAAEYWCDYADYIEPYNFGGGEGNAGVKEVAAVSLFGMYAVWYNFYEIAGYVSSGEDAGYNPPMDSWNYSFNIISDTEPVNDEIPLGTYTYVDYEKLASGEEELKTGIFTIEPSWGVWCMYVDANGEMQEYKYTEGTMVVSEGKIELTVTLENGEVHHVVYEGSLQTWGQGA